MIDYEALQTVYAIRSTGAADAAIFLTLVSAYLVVAYLVGSKLSSFQAWTISALYSLFAYFNVMAVSLVATDLIQLDAAPPGIDFLVPVMGLIWVVSIVFMVQIRLAARRTDDR